MIWIHNYISICNSFFQRFFFSFIFVSGFIYREENKRIVRKKKTKKKQQNHLDLVSKRAKRMNKYYARFNTIEIHKNISIGYCQAFCKVKNGEKQLRLKNCGLYLLNVTKFAYIWNRNTLTHTRTHTIYLNFIYVDCGLVYLIYFICFEVKVVLNREYHSQQNNVRQLVRPTVHR